MVRFFYDLFPQGSCKNYMRSTVEITDDKYVINVDLPGHKKEDIEISLEDDILTVKANRKQEEKQFILDERYYGELSRSYRLQDVKDEGIKANYENGVLAIVVPKLTEAETKTIITIE